LSVYVLSCGAVVDSVFGVAWAPEAFNAASALFSVTGGACLEVRDVLVLVVLVEVDGAD
jgi:hypothetical protein